MVKRSGSRSSRSDRRAERKRAERARERGLPVSERRESALRARAATPAPLSADESEARSSEAPRPVRRTNVPTLIKVIGAALVILLGVYLLGRQREQALTEPKPTPEPSVSSPLVDSASRAPSAAALTPPPPLEPDAVTPSALEPTVSAPSVHVPSKPTVSRPSAPRVKLPAPVTTPAPAPLATPAPVTAPTAPASPVVAAPAD